MTAMAGAHAVMVAVMVMTPVHLGHGGATLQIVGLVISLHIAGMYALSPVMGDADRPLGSVADDRAGHRRPARLTADHRHRQRVISTPGWPSG